ncbi:MAG: hypothetical protein AB7Q00_10660 [Phycisphaerales bacterium]
MQKHRPPHTHTPAWATLSFSFVNSIGTCIATSTGLFFLTKHSFHFTEAANCLLGMLVGATYIAGALSARGIVEWTKRRWPMAGTRDVLVGVMFAMAVLACLPWFDSHVIQSESTATRSPWAVWVFAGLYSPLTGILWPIVESFVSGGLRGVALRKAVGQWNITWSAALVPAMLLLPQFIEDSADIALLCLAPLHVVAALIAIVAIAPEPLPHDDSHPPAPASYRGLLDAFRILLPASYFVSCVMSPMLPTLLERVGFDAKITVVVAGLWLLTRTFTFVALERMSSWHGRISHPIVGFATLVLGFGLVSIGPLLPDVLAPWISSTGLGFFGVGMGAIYTGAIYYALAVGNSEVDAGGKHEAFIGAGYFSGPSAGLLAVLVARGVAGKGESAVFGPYLLGAAALVCVPVGYVVVKRLLRVAAEPGVEGGIESPEHPSEIA